MPKTLFRNENTKYMYFEKPEGSGRNLLVVKNAKIFAKNFSGERSKFGTKSFCLDIPEEIKDLLLDDGWDIHISKPYHEDDDPGFFLSVKIKFNEYGPEITKTGPNTPVQYDERTVGVLDDCDISDIDLIITPYKGETKTTAYLREMRFKQSLSPLDYDDEDDEEEYIPNF